MSETGKHNCDAPSRRITAAVLYPGELGAGLGAVLAERGLRVVTTLIDRGPRTTTRCHDAGIEVLASFEDVVRSANLVISLVPPAAAEEVAEAYCKPAEQAPAGAIYVDANSIGPDLAASIGAKIEASGVSFVDAAINGLAKNLRTSGTFYLSGTRASEIAAMIGNTIRVRVLGGEVGRASAMKMLLAGLSKGICALYAELALLAQRQGMQKELVEATALIYPGVAALVERMLPTYAQHAVRRATEMQELEQTARWMGLEPCVIGAVKQTHENLARVAFSARDGADVESFIERLAEEELLAADLTAAKDVPICVLGSK